MSISIIQDGKGRGPAEVSNGDLHTLSKCRPLTVYQTNIQADDTAATLLSEREGRNGLAVSVIGPSDLYLTFDGTTPTPTSFRLAAGSVWTFPACNTCEGEIKGVTESGTCDVSFLEFAP